MKSNRLLLTLAWLLVAWVSKAQYTEDILGATYQQQTISMPDDYEGKTVSTLVRKAEPQTGRRAILYIHGYNDYFFQAQLGDSVVAHGYNFYALDLRKYGRSLLPNQDAFYCRSLDEYFADIDTAIALIQKEGSREIILMGHSTGGLISSYYLKHHPQAPVVGLALNSPFLDWNFGWFMESVAIPTVSFLGKFFPDWIIQGTSGDASYAKSLLQTFKGEWTFDTSLKMPAGYGLFIPHNKTYKTSVPSNALSCCSLLHVHTRKQMNGTTNICLRISFFRSMTSRSSGNSWDRT